MLFPAGSALSLPWQAKTRSQMRLRSSGGKASSLDEPCVILSKLRWYYLAAAAAPAPCSENVMKKVAQSTR